MMEYKTLIEETSLIHSLPDKDIEQYIKTGKFRVVSYKKSSVIHFDGDVCRKLEIILSGKVVVDRIDESGNSLTVSEFFGDDILGGNLLYSRNPHFPMTVIAQSPTLILEIDKEILFELLSKNPPFLRTYLEFISDHAFILGDKIKHYINRTIRESILNYLNYESKKQNSKHIKLNITKKAISEKIGVQRTSLSRELAKMKKDGLISFDANSITLLR